MAGDERQWPLERLVLGIDELKVVLGADVAPQVERVKEHLVRALAPEQPARGGGRESQGREESGCAESQSCEGCG